MSAERRSSLTDRVDRTCWPTKAATDRERLNCLLCNYPHASRNHRPIPGLDKGFFTNLSDDYTVLKRTKRMGISNNLVKVVGPFSNSDISWVRVIIKATKTPPDEGSDYPFYMIHAAAIATDAQDEYIQDGHICIVAGKLSDNSDQEWTNMSFDGVMDRLRWGCKIIFDSYGEDRDDDEGNELKQTLGLFTAEEIREMSLNTA